jgi:maltose/moltooligosaccharide transporter
MQRPPRSFWQIWNMSFGFLGIQFGFGLQLANMSAIYEVLGATPDKLPLLWLAAPLSGLIIQPLIGNASDRTWGPLGRRRPYFLARCDSQFAHAHPYAEFVRALDGGRRALDS